MEPCQLIVRPEDFRVVRTQIVVVLSHPGQCPPFWTYYGLVDVLESPRYHISISIQMASMHVLNKTHHTCWAFTSTTCRTNLQSCVAVSTLFHASYSTVLGVSKGFSQTTNTENGSTSWFYIRKVYTLSTVLSVNPNLMCAFLYPYRRTLGACFRFNLLSGVSWHAVAIHPSMIRSDNGTNFRGANRELRLEEQRTQGQISEFCSRSCGSSSLNVHGGLCAVMSSSPLRRWPHIGTDRSLLKQSTDLDGIEIQPRRPLMDPAFSYRPISVLRQMVRHFWPSDPL